MGKKTVRAIIAMWLIVTTNVQIAWSVAPQIAVPVDVVSHPANLLPGQSVTLLPSGQWLLLGGQAKNGPMTTAVLQDPLTGTSRTLKSGMLLARAWHTATLLPNGLVLVIGGTTAGGKTVQNAELFDPNSLISGTAVTGLLPRAHHSATLLTDGTVLVAGGVGDDGSPVEAVESWNAQSNQASILPARLEDQRRDHTASLLADGTVLLWGGTDAHMNPLSYAELYHPTTQDFTYTTYLPGVVDMNLPVLEASLPADGETGVSINTVIALRFSKLLQVQTLNLGNAILSGPNGEVATRVVPAEGGRLAFVTPVLPLQAGSTYLLTVNGPVDGQGLGLVQKSISFTTAGAFSTANNSTAKNGSNAATTPAQDLPPLLAPPGVTALSGQTLLVSGQPLSRVTISIGSQRTRTDRTGRFLLPDIESGHQVFVIEGATANIGTIAYGLFEVGTEIKPGITNVLNYKIWMTPLDTVHAVSIPSPTVTDTIVTNPVLPGLKLDLPPDTVIYDHYGRVVHQITITPIRLDRPPFPIPQGLNITFYFTIQPGGAYLRIGGGKYPRGARLIYPNVHNMLAGTPFSFWNYDPDQKGWFVYGMGRVTPDQKEVVPNPGVSIYEFTGAMDGGGTNGPGTGSPGGGGGGGGDPVDASTGLFIYKHTDFYLPDVIPIDITRTYRQGDPFPRAFGIGTTIGYDIVPIGDQFPYTYMDLVLPDGGRVHYYRISPGTSYGDAVFFHNATPTKFYGSTITWDSAININGGGWLLRFKDGTEWGFPDSYQATTAAQGSIVFVKDRYGNTLNISRCWNPGSNGICSANGGGKGTIEQITSPNGRWLQFTYDSCNRVQQITDSMGRLTHYTYDTNPCNTGHLLQAQDLNGNTTTYAYDPVNIDQMTSITDGRNIQYLQNTYDSNGRVHQQILANQGTYTFGYNIDTYGNITQTTLTDPNGNQRQMNFSTPPIFESGFQTGGYLTSQTFALGKPEQQTYQYNLGTPASNPGNFVQSMTDPLNRTTSYTYDALGNTTSITQLSGTSLPSTTTLAYEPTFSRVTSFTDPNGNTTSFSYNDGINQIVATDPLGNQWTASQNPVGQVLSLKDPASDNWEFGYTGADLTSFTDALNNVTNYTYDGAGRRVSTVDPLGERTSFTYDGLNHLLSVTDPLGEVTKYNYDQNSNLTSVIDPKNTANPTKFAYNNMDQMYQRTDALLNNDSYQYDLNGNPTCHTDRKGQITVYGYDGLNRETLAGYGAASCTATTFANSTSYTYDGVSRLHTAVDSIAGTVTRQYDGLDDLNYENSPQGTINYTFDSARRRKTMTVTGQSQISYGYDPANHLLQVSQGSTAINLTYDNVGRRSNLTFPNSVSVGYSYDADSHVIGIAYQNGSTGLGNLGYSYDQLGRISQVFGNYAKTTIPSAVSSAAYNTANQITSWAGTSVTYDADGNLQNDGSNTYTWDLRNHLSAISGGSTGSFQYDGVGRRVNKTINGSSTSLLYDRWNVVQELSGSTPTANVITGLSPDEIFARTDSAGIRYFLRDVLGNTLGLATQAGSVATSYTYEPFGNTSVTGSSSGNAYEYTGRENDGTGLYYYRARYYKPGFGRFTSEDPIGFAGGINLFAYAANNPVNFVDHFGFKPKDELSPCVGSFGSCALAGMFASMASLGDWATNEVAVIGKLADTGSWARQGYNVFNMEGEWYDVQAANDAWMQSVIDSGQPIIVGSDLTEANLLGDYGLFDAGFSTFGSELGMALEAGYEFATVEEAGEVLLVLVLL